MAALTDGQVPGSRAFAAATGIRETEWRGVHWARWGDALVEAGFAPNEWQGRFDSSAVLEQLAGVCRHYGHMPTRDELQIYRRAHPGAVSHKTVENHFGTKAEATNRLREWAAERPAFADVTAMLGPPVATASREAAPPVGAEGWVYLARSGQHYKIGRASDVERRMKQIQPALPEALTPEHFIRTDDPPGIEAYWHRRFADRRANGEWFKLTRADVAAFKRRKFQ